MFFSPLAARHAALYFLGSRVAKGDTPEASRMFRKE
jgi:hypothetical protein